MFLFSPKFDWSFSHLPRFNWGCWTLPKCSYFTQMFLILPKTLLKLFSGPNCMKAAGITTWYQFTQGQCLFGHQGQKEWQRFGHYFSVDLVIICLSLENRHYLIACECSCTLCPNLENFFSNNGQFFSVGHATASPCRMLMPMVN